MTESAKSTPSMIPVSTKSILWRGVRERCPQCGRGRLFTSYLRQNGACPVCGEDFSHIRADDGPAWLTILLTCHIVVPVAVYLAMHDVMPEGAELTLLLILTIAAAFLILPRAKGLFIGALWLLAKKKRIAAQSSSDAR